MTVAGADSRMLTLALLWALRLQELDAVTVSWTVPVLPAWKVIVSPVVADVIVPPAICQVCVIPERAGTEAVAVAPAWMLAGSEMVDADGAAPIVLVAVAEAPPQELVAVAVNVTTPDAPAWNVIASPVVAEVIVPPVICH
jgi:hypothetical protein